MARPGKLRAEWLAALAEDIAALQGRGPSRSSSCPRARSRSGGGLLELERRQPDAGAAAGGGERRTDCPEPGLGREPGAARDRHRPDPDNTQYHRGAPLLPQCAHHDHDAARAGRDPDHQRERFRRHAGNPLWRQRPAERARRDHDRGGLPDPAVRHRRTLHGAASARPQCAGTFPFVPAITAEIEEMAGGAASHLQQGRHDHQDRGRQDRDPGRDCHDHRQGHGDPSACGADATAAPHTLFAAAESRAQARKRWIMGTLDVAGSLQVDAGAATRPTDRARACCRSA